MQPSLSRCMIRGCATVRVFTKAESLLAFNTSKPAVSCRCLATTHSDATSSGDGKKSTTSSSEWLETKEEECSTEAVSKAAANTTAAANSANSSNRPVSTRAQLATRIAPKTSANRNSLSAWKFLLGIIVIGYSAKYFLLKRYKQIYLNAEQRHGEQIEEVS